VVPQPLVLDALGHLLRWLVPGQSNALVRELANFLEHRAVIGWVLLLTMIFFSSLAFTVLENAMSLIFVHRVVVKRRHFLISALLPYCYILCLGIGLLIVTCVSSALETIGAEGIELLGLHVPLAGFSRIVLYVLGLAGEIFVLTSIYLVMPVGRPSIKHALIGGVVAGVLWEITRHVLVWYFATLSQVSLVYGSLTMAIVILLSFEWLATLLLFGAQVISQYERFGHEPLDAPQPRIETG